MTDTQQLRAFVLSAADFDTLYSEAGLRPSEPDGPPTFDELAAIEPSLADLLIEAKQSKRPGTAVDRFYGYGPYGPGFKPRIVALVGWGCERDDAPILRTRAAYDVVYETILDAIPTRWDEDEGWS